MTPEQFLERLAAVRIDRSHGGRAPHKPLMLLLALGRVGLGHSRLIPYETADERFKELWEEFGRPGTPPRAYYPFGRLRNDDGLWEIPEESQLSRGREADLLVSEAKGLGITGGFRQDVHDLLCGHPELVSRAASLILTEHFPPSIGHYSVSDHRCRPTDHRFRSIPIAPNPDTRSKAVAGYETSVYRLKDR